MAPFSSPHDRARAYLADARTVLVLTGAGVSAESGVPTFRGEGGLWKSYRAEQLATPAAFARDPRLVWEWYGWRRELVAGCRPNAAHRALAEFAARRAGVVLATQNVDGLHARAAAELPPSAAPQSPPPAAPVELHGSLFRVRCTLCPHAAPHDAPVDASTRESLPRCPVCGALLRPGVVWFGETLEAPVLAAALRAAERADVCLVVGTSALVQPAASLAAITREAGGRVVEVNPAETPISAIADEVLRGAAGEVVPERVAAGAAHGV